MLVSPGPIVRNLEGKGYLVSFERQIPPKGVGDRVKRDPLATQKKEQFDMLSFFFFISCVCVVVEVEERYWDSNPGLHACKASTLPLVTSLAPI